MAGGKMIVRRKRKTLGKKIADIMDKKTETKQHLVWKQFDNANFIDLGSDGTTVPLHLINGGSRNGERDGESIAPKSLELSYNLGRNVDAKNKSKQYIRVSLLRTYDCLDARSRPNGGDYPTSINESYDASKFFVYYDKWHTIDEQHQQTAINNVRFRNLPKMTWTDSAGANISRGRLYLRFTAYAEGDALNSPEYAFSANLKYKDS